MKKNISLNKQNTSFSGEFQEETPYFSSFNAIRLFLCGFFPCVAVLSSKDADELAMEKGFGCLMEMLSLFGEGDVNDFSKGSLQGLRFVPLKRTGDSLEERLEWIEECSQCGLFYVHSSYILREMRPETLASDSNPLYTKVKKDVPLKSSIEDSEEEKVSSSAHELENALISEENGPEVSIEGLVLNENSIKDLEESNVSTSNTLQQNALKEDTVPKKKSEHSSKSSLDLSSTFDLYFRFLASLPPSSHESFSHPVACICAVSSYSPTPLKTLESLLEQRSNLSLPSYIDLGYLLIYLFIHSDSHDFEKSLQTFQTIQQTFGAHSYFIKLSSMNETEKKSWDTSTSISENSCNIFFDLPKDTRYLYNNYIKFSNGSHNLLDEDISAIRTFVKELISQSILPVMKRSIDVWNEQFTAPPKGISGKLLSISKKYFGTSISGNSYFYQNGNYDATTSSYPSSSPEAQLRKLADYAFMLHDWKFAQSIYELLKKDFFDDNAWKYYAGVQEMSIFCLLLLPMHSTKIKIETIDSMLDSSLYSYLSRCSSPFFALRCIIFASELMSLRSNKAKNNAAKWLIKILESGILGNTITALLTERIATYFASVETFGVLQYGSRHKKAAFWKILTAEAWLRIGKKRLAQQSLKDAMEKTFTNSKKLIFLNIFFCIFSYVFIIDDYQQVGMTETLIQKTDGKSFEKGCLLIEFVLNRQEFTATRLPSLYSDFSLLKDSNPEGYNANICAWKYALQEAVWANRITWRDDYLVIHCDDKLLASLYTIKYGTPLGIIETMKDAIKNKEWVLLNDFLGKKKSIYGYLFSFISSLFIWSLQGFGLLTRRSCRFNTICVIMQHVECASNSFLALVQDRTMYSEHIYSLDELVTCFSDKVLSPRILSRLDMEIIVHYLSSYKKEICTGSNGHIIKLRGKNRKSATNVTEADMLVLKLKTVRDQLQQLIQILTRNVEQFDETIKAAVKAKNKALALFHLRSKKSSESTLKKRLQALEQIKEVLCKIDEAAVNMDILNSIKGGADVLETLVKAIGGIKNVEKIMEKAKMLSCELKDIGKVLGEIDLSDISDAQIEEEFEVLLNSFTKENIKDEAANAVNHLLSHIDLTVPIPNSPLDPCAVNELSKKAIKITE
ncbi:hypothetical protein PORY_001037 [Pneumocystis oryctolagi]|uniref:Uncharacterized protein n=1 Tax=Pneumocystis oryctolagi TaxID=42067 RepID=A0ACB7CCX0_9ASCO|nr:hypothetical protein PORY_001037 [Pneumocystis oryctolagi]